MSTDRLHALGCPLTGCDWHSQPYPATTGRHNVAAIKAYIWHIYTAHPQYRGLIDHARASVRTGDTQ